MCFVFRLLVWRFFLSNCVLFVSLLHDFKFSPPESPSQFQLYVHAYIYIKLGTKHICWSRWFSVVQCKGCDVLQEDTCSRVKYVYKLCNLKNVFAHLQCWNVPSSKGSKRFLLEMEKDGRRSCDDPSSRQSALLALPEERHECLQVGHQPLQDHGRHLSK